MKWLCLNLGIFIMIFSVPSISAETSFKTIEVKVHRISDLPKWYQEKQSYITKDFTDRYHRTNTNTVRHLIVDSFDKKKNITVESTKSSINLFLNTGNNSSLIESNHLGIMSVHWSYDSKYFIYQTVTRSINDAQVFGTIYLVKIETNLNDLNKIKLRGDISIGDMAWDNQTSKFVFTDYEKLYIYFLNNGRLYEIKDRWSKRPSGYPQRVDNIFFSDDGINMIFRYCGYYAGDKYEYYQIDCSDIK